MIKNFFNNAVLKDIKDRLQTCPRSDLPQLCLQLEEAYKGAGAGAGGQRLSKADIGVCCRVLISFSV